MKPQADSVVSRRSVLKLLGSSVVALTPLALPAEKAQKSTGGMAAAQLQVNAIVHNQIGFRPAQRKVATVVWGHSEPFHVDHPLSFRVWTADMKHTVFTGAVSTFQKDDLSGDMTSQADFSQLAMEGQYRLEVEGTVGDVFPIAENVYREALRVAMRSYYGQRCGCEVDLGGGYEHGKCHNTGAFHASSGKTGKTGSAGGWHDAGDYGRYVVNSGITCGTLLWAWEFFPQQLHSLPLRIPESGKGVPDFLAEVRWNLLWMLSMQDPADGGVWHKQTSVNFCAFILPQEDTLVSEVIGTGSAPFKSTCASADFASTMAIAARCFKRYDPSFAAQCLEAARKAYGWTLLHPDVAFKNPAGVTTGEYGDPVCSDELLWASAELFRTTGEPSFEQDFLKQASLPSSDLKVQAPSWGGVASLGFWAYAMNSLASSTTLVQSIQRKTMQAAESLMQQAGQNGYGHTLAARDYGWGSNSTAANQALLLIVADRMIPNSAARDAAMANLHYLLGQNCFGISWLTQVGIRPFLHPHHRPSAADNIAAPWPGLLSAGPNAHGGDPVADALPHGAPMRAWVDDVRAYSLNEVAINWNAPLVFLLAAANS